MTWGSNEPHPTRRSAPMANKEGRQNWPRLPVPQQPMRVPLNHEWPGTLEDVDEVLATARSPYVEDSGPDRNWQTKRERAEITVRALIEQKDKAQLRSEVWATKADYWKERAEKTERELGRAKSELVRRGRMLSERGERITDLEAKLAQRPTITGEEIRAVRMFAGGPAAFDADRRLLRTLADKLENEAWNPQD